MSDYAGKSHSDLVAMCMVLERELSAMTQRAEAAESFAENYLGTGSKEEDSCIQEHLSIIRPVISATSETVAAWRAKETEPLRMEVARLIAALRKIVDEGDYTAPEGMTRVAKEALNDTKATALAYEREVKAKALEEAANRFKTSATSDNYITSMLVAILNEWAAELRANKGE